MKQKGKEEEKPAFQEEMCLRWTYTSFETLRGRLQLCLSWPHSLTLSQSSLCWAWSL